MSSTTQWDRQIDGFAYPQYICDLLKVTELLYVPTSFSSYFIYPSQYLYTVMFLLYRQGRLSFRNSKCLQ